MPGNENNQEENKQDERINPAAKLAGSSGSILMSIAGAMYCNVMDRVEDGVDGILNSIPLVGGLLSGLFRGAMTLVNYAVGGVMAAVGFPLSLPGRGIRAAINAFRNRSQSSEPNQAERGSEQPQLDQEQPQLDQEQPQREQEQPQQRYTPEERQSEIDFLAKNASDKDLGIIDSYLASGLYSVPSEAGKKQILSGATDGDLKKISDQVHDRLAGEQRQNQHEDAELEHLSNKVDSKLTGKDIEAKEDLKNDIKGPQPQKEEKAGPEQKEEQFVRKQEEDSVPKREQSKQTQSKQKEAAPEKNTEAQKENIFKRSPQSIYSKNARMARFAAEAERAERRVGAIHDALQQGKEVAINMDTLRNDLFIMNMDHQMRLDRQHNLMKNGMESPGQLEKILAQGKTSGFEEQGLIIRNAIGNKLKNADPDQIKDMTGGLTSQGFRDMIKEADKAPLKERSARNETGQRERQTERTNQNRHRSMTSPKKEMSGPQL